MDGPPTACANILRTGAAPSPAILFRSVRARRMFIGRENCRAHNIMVLTCVPPLLVLVATQGGCCVLRKKEEKQILEQGLNLSRL